MFIVILVLGTYDTEDIFHAQYSAGAPFGGLFHHQDSTLVQTLLGVPVYDSGVTGGYRLPFQGTLNTSWSWPLHRYLSLEFVLSLHLLVALVAGAMAVANFITTWQPVGTNSLRRGRVFAILVWIALCYPVMEYLLLEDWYSVALPYLGFLVTMSGLLARPMFDRSIPDAPKFCWPLWSLIIGTYLMFVGHFSMVIFYAPWILISLTPFAIQLTRAHKGFKGLLRELWIPCIIGLLVVLRVMIVVTDIAHEVLQRPEVSSLCCWWANPTKSSGDFKHFLGQLFAVEMSPWLRYLRPGFLTRFNVSSTGLNRLPVSAPLLAVISCFSLVFGNLEGIRRRVAAVLLATWLAVFLIMIKVVPFPVRASADYLYRDVLLVLIALATVLTALPSATSRYSRLSRPLRLALVSALIIGPVAATATRPIFRIETWGVHNPYAPLRQMLFRSTWYSKFSQEMGSEGGTLGIADPMFPERYADRSRSPNESDWRGLRGYHQLRQFNLQSIEGFPKLRNASAFTGEPREFKQRINRLTIEHCTQELLVFLNVNLLLVKSGESMQACVTRISSLDQPRPIAISFTNPRALADSGMSWTRLNIGGVVALGEDSAHSQVITCGVIADPNCLASLGTEISTSWIVDKGDCGQRCLLTVKPNGLGSKTSLIRVLLPINSGNGIRFFADDGEEISHSTVNGLAVVDLRSTTTSVRAVLDPDWRMWLQVLAAWSQFFGLIPVLATGRDVLLNKGLRARLSEHSRASS
jgi:hypothetical protein